MNALMRNLDPKKLTPQKWREIKEILVEALETPMKGREVWLEEHCSSDPELQEWVSNLLPTQAESFPSSPSEISEERKGDDGAALLGAFSEYYANLPLAERLEYLHRAQREECGTSGITDDEENVVNAGTQIGPYRIVKKIGSGGMGVVYLGKRVDDFEQEVAIKILARGEEGAKVYQRFLSERQLLASLNHPNIVRLLDGGTTSDGIPYIVMEYIAGEPILRYCELRHLGLESRLELFCQLCSAVHYAHQRLVVHRDLKPNNVLVTKDGVTKLLDFGIARVVPDGYDNPRTLTLAALTPEYASPEQLRGEVVTTAADVYSLGMLLYEMLTGVQPYRLAGRGIQEVVKAICEQEPKPPSMAILGSRANADGTPRHTVGWQKRLRGDLDTIALTALHKDPERRYSSAERFRDDIRCYLEGLPVSARPDTLLYRTGKYLRRYWGMATVISCLLLSIVTGTTLTIRAMVRAERERARAEDRLREVHSITNSLVFDVSDQIRTLPGSTSVQKHLADLAARYLPALEQNAGQDPGTLRDLADAYERLGDLQGDPRGPNLGDSVGAMASFKKAAQIRRKLKQLRPNDYTVDVALSKSNERIGDLLWAAGDPHCRRAYEAAQANLDRVESSHPDDQDVIARQSSTSDDLGDVAYDAKDYKAAMAHFSREMQFATRLESLQRGTLHAEDVLAVAHMKIGRVLDATGDFDGALREDHKAFEIRQNFAKTHPDNTVIRRELAATDIEMGEVYEDKKDLPASIGYLHEAIAGLKQLLQADPQNRQFQTDMKLAQDDLKRVLEKRHPLVSK